MTTEEFEHRMQVFHIGKELRDMEQSSEDCIKFGTRLVELSGVCAHCCGTAEDGDPPDANGDGGAQWLCERCKGGFTGPGFTDHRVLTCVYCGHEYPQDTPAWGNQALTDHIKVCEKHPMRQLEHEKAQLRSALRDLVQMGPIGVSDEDLKRATYTLHEGPVLRAINTLLAIK